MKQVIIISTILIFLFGCKEKCNIVRSCEEKAPAFNGNIITCSAYFETWFYNQESKECEKIGYSGCGPSGFMTLSECQGCKCND